MRREFTAMRLVPRTMLPRQRVFIAEAYEGHFPNADYPDYDAFLAAQGESIKSEPRTRVALLRRRKNASPEPTTHSFVLKIYRYPLLPRIRTGFRISKAEQEFNSLRYVNEQGVAAAEPVAFGVERTRLGFVRSCFVITSFVEGAVNLSRWRSANAQNKLPAEEMNHALLRQVGAMFHRLHKIRFFLFTAKTKNLLLRENGSTAPEILFIDIPYARTLRWQPVARWAQRRDLGVSLGNFWPALTESEMASFYQGYLPDPLGGSPTVLQRAVRRAMRAKQNLTPISALIHGFKRTVRKKLTAKETPESR